MLLEANKNERWAGNPRHPEHRPNLINVQDLQRATAFYRDVLGLPLLFTVPNLAFLIVTECG